MLQSEINIYPTETTNPLVDVEMCLLSMILLFEIVFDDPELRQHIHRTFPEVLFLNDENVMEHHIESDRGVG